MEPNTATEARFRAISYQDGLVLSTAAAVVREADLIPRVTTARGLDRAGLEQALTCSPHPGALLASVRALTAADLLGPDQVGTLASLLHSHDLVTTAVKGVDWDDYAALCEAVAEAVLEDHGRPESPDPADDAGAWLARVLDGTAATVVLPRIPPISAIGSEPELGPAVNGLLERLGLTDDRRPTPLGGRLSLFQPMMGLAGSYARPMLDLPGSMSHREGLFPPSINSRMDRKLNVLASGRAHQGYFRAAGRIIAGLFDDPDLDRQPRAVVDVGCGDGSWLRDVYRYVQDNTVRGAVLEQHPLLLVAVDVDERALTVARERMSGFDAAFLKADIGRPAELAERISEVTGLSPDEVLHLRAFVDHNRPLPEPRTHDEFFPAESDVYVSRNGMYLSPARVHQDWQRHLERWQDACGQHGMLVFEGHTLPGPELSGLRGSTHALSFAFYHAVSGQAPLPFDQFRSVVEAAGYRRAEGSVTFPAKGPAIASLSWLRPAR